MTPAIAAGYAHSLYLMGDGSVWASGYNGSGQLGDGTTSNRTTPVKVMTDVKAVAAGYSNSLFLKTDGTAWGAGSNLRGQFGNGATSVPPVTTPVQVMSDVKAIASGYAYSLFLKNDGTVWAVGADNNAQFGDNNLVASVTTPIQIMTDVQAIAAAENHSLFLKNDGSVWGAGYNAEGELGTGGSETYGGTPSRVMTPVQIMTGVKAIAAGHTHSLFLKTDGTAWGTGDNSQLQFGGYSWLNVFTPVQMATDVQAISAGERYSLFLKNDGSTVAVGSLKIPHGPTGVQAIAAGYGHALFLKTDGSIAGAGGDSVGQLGDGRISNYTTPVQAMAGVQAIAVTSFNSYFLKTDGTVWITNQDGSDATPVASGASALMGGYGVGYFLRPDHYLWTATTSPAVVMTDVQSVATGYDGHQIFLKTDGSAWASGNNADGQLGDGTRTTRTTPVQIIASGVQAVAAGLDYSLFLKTDGSVWITGSAFATNNTLVPVLSATGVKAISGGPYHRLYLKTDGSVWAAGLNGGGQLGDGTTTDRTTPVKVMTGVKTVSAGNGISLFLKTDGSVWAAGYNSFSGSASTSNTPSKIVSGGVQDIAAGNSHIMFLKTDGTAWGLGADQNNQLNTGFPGTNSAVTVLRSTPDLWIEYPRGTKLPAAPSSFDFGTTQPSSPLSKTVLARSVNTSGATLTGVSAVIEGDNAADFTLTAQPPSDMESGAEAQITVSFSPTGTGYRQAALKIYSNDPASPRVFALSGAGAAAGDIWRFTNFGIYDNQGTAADEADPDGDGVQNLVERAFNLPPRSAGRPVMSPTSGTSGLPLMGPQGDSGVFTIEFLRQKGATDLQYVPQFSNDLGVWEDATTEDSVESVDDQWERVIVHDPSPGSATRFGRVKVLTNP